MALTDLRQYDQASLAYDQAEQIQPSSTALQAGRLNILLGRAEQLRDQGKVNEAIGLYDAVLKQDPTNSTAQEELQQLLQRSVGAGR